MQELIYHIELLLEENDCVIVPNFGGFIVYDEPSHYSEQEQIFLPPNRKLIFNKKLRINDGLLAQSYMQIKQVDFSEAMSLIEHSVVELKKSIQYERKLALGKLGEISCNIHGEYIFNSYDNVRVYPSLYGLDYFEMKQLKNLKEAVAIQNIQNEEPKKKATRYNFSISKAFIRNTVAAVVAVVLFFSFSNTVGNTDTVNTVYATIIPEEIFKGKPTLISNKQEVEPEVKYNATLEEAINQDKQIEEMLFSSQEEIVTQTSTSDSQTFEVETEKIEIPTQKVAETKEEITIDDIENRPYHIIAIGGISKSAAQKIAEQYREKGFKDAIVITKDSKVRVSIMSFEDLNEANKALAELRQSEEHTSNWLLK